MKSFILTEVQIARVRGAAAADELARRFNRHVDFLTIGQYLQPTRNHLPVDRWVEPATFDHWKRVGLDLGFTVVESGPLVRSSYHAESQAQRIADGGDR